MTFFTEADFKLINESLNPSQSVRYMLADLANAKLESEGKVIELHQGYELSNSFLNHSYKKEVKHTALLINIEPIEPKCPNSHKDFVCGNYGKNFDLVPKPKACEHEKSKLSEPYQARGLDYAWVRKCECGHVVVPCAHPNEKIETHLRRKLDKSSFEPVYQCSLCKQRVKATKWEVSE